MYIISDEMTCLSHEDISLRKVRFLVFSLIVLIAALNINVGSAQNFSTADGLAVTMSTNKNQYSNNPVYYPLGEPIQIQGMVYNSTTCNSIPAIVLIEISKNDNVIYTSSTVALANGSYYDEGYRVSDTGVLKIKVTAVSGNSTANASTNVISQYYYNFWDLYNTYFYQIWLVAIVLAYFIALIAFQSKPFAKTKPISEKPKAMDKFWELISRLFIGRLFVASMFVFLTLFTIIIVLSLFFFPSPLGFNSPIGLVVNNYGNETQWVVNIGGALSLSGDSYQYTGGIQIPVYVIVLSFIGAYVYFLNKVPQLIKLQEKALANDALKYLVRFFMAPLLAISLFLVLWQVEVRGTFILGAVSFATGLIIEEVVDRILEFAKDVIGKKSKEPEAKGNSVG